jgi:Flp pilus assembly secretin CpaC
MRRKISPAPRLSIVLIAALLASAGFALAVETGSKPPIAVIIDRAKVMHISRPADTIIIGNPGIADATIQDAQTLIITGKSFGSTNLIVLDAQGQPIADEVLSVQPNDDSVVTIFRRASRVTLSCTPDCSPTLAIGDATESFDTLNSQIGTHNSRSGAE